MNLPFTYSYTILNNILTIVFDFSSMSYEELSSIKRDYFSQGLVINTTGFDMYFGFPFNRTHTYRINTKRFDWDGESVINLRLMGYKVTEHNKATYGSYDNEHQVSLYAANDFQKAIDHIIYLKSNDQKELEQVNQDLEKPHYNNATDSYLNRQKQSIEIAIAEQDKMIDWLTTERNKVSS